MKNVIVFNTDQQRADSLGCMGNRLARTPVIDQLAAEGVVFRRHYAVNPVCMPSRAAFLTGRYPQVNGVCDNGIRLPETEVTLPELFRRRGYRTASFGKIHLQNYMGQVDDTSMESSARWESGQLDGWTGPYYGFETALLTSCHGDRCGGAYGQWRKRAFPEVRIPDQQDAGVDSIPALACYPSVLPLEAHHSTWVAEGAVRFLREVAGSPFYMHVSFADPHHPFAAIPEYLRLFSGVRFPPPHAVAGENDTKPRPYRDAMNGDPFNKDGNARCYAELTADAHQRIMAHTHGMIALIDDCIGRVLKELERLRLREGTLLLFTSDHGDFLGDHGFLFKGQLPCRSLLHIPLIMVDPGGDPGIVDEVTSNIDVMPTVLEVCGLEQPDFLQGVVLPEPGEAPRRDHAFEIGWSKASRDYHHFSIIKREWRLSYFPLLKEGELYDLHSDPWEHHNLFASSAHREIRDRLMGELLAAEGAANCPVLPYAADW